jgi:hypothetical protein
MTNSKNNNSQPKNQVVTNAVLVTDQREISVSVPHITPNSNVYSTRTIIPNNELTNNMLKTYNLSKSVKIFSLIDMFFSFIYAFYDFYMFFPLICSFAGYYGCKNYRVGYINIYICYQICNILLRTVLFTVLVNQNTDLSFLSYLFFLLTTIIGLWILQITVKLSKVIATLTVEQLQILRNMRLVPASARIVYY